MRFLFLTIAMAASLLAYYDLRTNPSLSAPSAPVCSATYEGFKSLKQGYDEGKVKSLMGCRGSFVSEQRIGDASYRTFRFDGEKPGSFMIVTYTNGLTDSIMQVGLD